MSEFLSPEAYLSHRKEMLLIDSVHSAEDDRVCTLSRISERHIFYCADLQGVPAWLGLELMAQSAAIWVGMEDRRQNQPVGFGFLLGSRKYTSHVDVFRLHQSLKTQIEVSLNAEDAMVFEGRIVSDDGECLAEGSITAYRPKNIDEYIRWDSA